MKRDSAQALTEPAPFPGHTPGPDRLVLVARKGDKWICHGDCSALKIQVDRPLMQCSPSLLSLLSVARSPNARGGGSFPHPSPSISLGFTIGLLPPRVAPASSTPSSLPTGLPKAASTPKDRGEWSRLLFVLPIQWGRQVRVRQAVRVSLFVGLKAPIAMTTSLRVEAHPKYYR